jgi:hypothetical protein
VILDSFHIFRWCPVNESFRLCSLILSTDKYYHILFSTICTMFSLMSFLSVTVLT